MNPYNSRPGSVIPNHSLGAGNSAQAESASPVRDAISLSERLSSEIHENIACLEKRLDTIVTPQPPVGPNTTNAKTPTPVHSHVMGRLAILNESLSEAANRLRALMNRVEL